MNEELIENDSSGIEWDYYGDLFDVDSTEGSIDLDSRRSETTDSENGSNGSVLGKRIRYKYYVRLPKVLKRDIRRQYPSMIANVLNSYDFSLFHSFFKTFSNGSVGFKLKDLSNIGIDTNDMFSHLFMTETPQEMDYQGYHWIFYYWHVLTSLNSDYIVRVKEARIVSRVGTEWSKLHMKMLFEFTRVYDIQLVWFLVSIFKSLVSDTVSRSSGVSVNGDTNSHSQNNLMGISGIDETSMLEEEYETVEIAQSGNANVVTSLLPVVPPDPFEFYFSRSGSQMPLLSTPEKMTLELQFVFHLNEYKQIVLLETSDLSIMVVES